MAWPNAADPSVALVLILQIWESLISAKYMKEVCHYNAGPCPTCNFSKTCNNYFCLQCKTGGLCPAVFRGDNEHRDHPWLQVRHYTRQYSVGLENLEHFMSKEGLKHIHANKLKDGNIHCNLRSKKGSGSRSSSRSSSSSRARARAEGEKSCQGCTAILRESKHSEETFLVCSLQCLLKVARKRGALNLLAMNDGAMDPMQPPLFFSEKKFNSPRMLETRTKAPVDEAPPSPQATGDYPMSETREALAQKATDEAPPSPQATGDFPMSETREALAQKATDELPHRPQATEDSPMREAPPAVPEDTFKLEEFTLPPPEFEDLHFGPEWEFKDLESMIPEWDFMDPDSMI